MKSQIAMAFATVLLSAGVASAATVTVDFDGPTSFASIDQFYNGGTDSSGAAGTNLGISFGLDALALQNDVLGPYFSNAPSPTGILAPVGSAAAMTIFGGPFTGVVSLYYSSTATGSIKVYSDENGTGSLLGQFDLTNNAQSNGCSDSAYCNWTFATLNLGNGVGRSIDFGTAAGVAAFDNLTVETVPLPAALPMLAAGLAGLGALGRRKARGVAGSAVHA